MQDCASGLVSFELHRLSKYPEVWLMSAVGCKLKWADACVLLPSLLWCVQLGSTLHAFMQPHVRLPFMMHTAVQHPVPQQLAGNAVNRVPAVLRAQRHHGSTLRVGLHLQVGGRRGW